MIEDVTKSTRRKKEINAEYFEKLYADTTSLYHLDQIGAASEAREDLGPLPGTAIALLAALGIAWACIICYVISDALKMKKLKHGAAKH